MRSLVSNSSPSLRARVSLLALFCFAPVGAASAQEAFFSALPPYSGEISFELGVDSVVNSDDPDAELTDVFGSAELALRVEATENLAVNFGATLESVLDPEKDRVFEDIGLYVDTLNLEGSFGDFVVTAGKFAPGFGLAYDLAPGIWSGDLAGDYELTEQLGFGVSWAPADPFPVVGEVALGANIFNADTTFLSDSAFTRRGRLHRSDGGAGNAGGLSSFSLTADGSGIEAAPGLAWHLGYRRLKAGEGDAGSEQSFVFGLSQEFELSDETSLTAFGEVARLKNAGGSDQRVTYGTLGLGVVHGPWHGEIGGSTRSGKGPGGSWDDELLQISGGYVWENGIDLSLGYARVSEDGVDSDVIGLRMTRDFSF